MKLRQWTASDWDWHRTPSSDPEVSAAVQDILKRVQTEGDAAVRAYTKMFDAPDLEDGFSLRVPEEQLASAWGGLDSRLQAALRHAAERIRHFHALQLPADIRAEGADGAVLGLVWRPIERVGVYVPGGRAVYPSTVLMNIVPAQVAGVSDIALASPPQRDTGLPHPLVLAAAHLLGVREVYRMGGAHAIGALAYGTQSVGRAAKITGPGNLYVAMAKRAVMGDVGIDSIAGPSEVFIVADETANASYVAADMLAQAEHDPEAGAVCVTTQPGFAVPLNAALEQQLSTLPKQDIARAALEKWGAVVVVRSIEEAVAVVNRSAPEHVELHVKDPEACLSSIRTAGAVFLGPYTPEPVGDYYAGTNHVLPTHGSARYASGLGVHDFLRRMSYAAYQEETLQAHSTDIIALAEAEALSAHARSIAIRTTGSVLS